MVSLRICPLSDTMDPFWPMEFCSTELPFIDHATKFLGPKWELQANVKEKNHFVVTVISPSISSSLKIFCITAYYSDSQGEFILKSRG